MFGGVCLESSLTLSEETETSCSRSEPEEQSISPGPMESGIMHGGVHLRTTRAVCLTRLAFSTPRRNWVAFGSGLCEDTPYPSLKMSRSLREFLCVTDARDLMIKSGKDVRRRLPESSLILSENANKKPSDCQDEYVRFDLAGTQGTQLMHSRIHPRKTGRSFRRQWHSAPCRGGELHLE